jgi:hypothetical protein
MCDPEAVTSGMRPVASRVREIGLGSQTKRELKPPKLKTVEQDGNLKLPSLVLKGIS